MDRVRGSRFHLGEVWITRGLEEGRGLELGFSLCLVVNVVSGRIFLSTCQLEQFV